MLHYPKKYYINLSRKINDLMIIFLGSYLVIYQKPYYEI